MFTRNLCVHRGTIKWLTSTNIRTHIEHIEEKLFSSIDDTSLKLVVINLLPYQGRRCR
jgi:hypothetical protein